MGHNVINQDELLLICARIFQEDFDVQIPEDTGNMRYNAKFIRQVSENEIEIGIDGEIAPYMVYTNEPWISPKWKGAENPNEYWFDLAARSFADELARRLGANVRVIGGKEVSWEKT